MSESETSDEKAERATGLKHVSGYTMPVSGKLPPSMGILNEQKASAWIIAKTVSDIEKEVRREIWQVRHPGQQVPDELKTEPRDEDAPEPMFDITKYSGGDRIVAAGMNSLADNLMNVSPTVSGLGRRQAFAFALAQKSGVAVEPKSQTLWQKIRGKNKPENQISGGGQ